MNSNLIEAIVACQKVLDDQYVPTEGRFMFLPNGIIKLYMSKRLNARRWKKRFKKIFGARKATVMNSPNKRGYYR